MKILIIIALFAILIISGCTTQKQYYKNGQLKSERSGWLDWSNGTHKTILPISVSGIGV